MKGYHIGLTWVTKVCFDGHLACKIYVDVDDRRATVHCCKLCWAVVRKFATTYLKYGDLGAAQNRTFPSNTP